MAQALILSEGSTLCVSALIWSAPIRHAAELPNGRCEGSLKDHGSAEKLFGEIALWRSVEVHELWTCGE